MGSLNPNVYQLVEPRSKTMIVGVRGIGGIQITISCYNKLYDQLAKDPSSLEGMVFDCKINTRREFIQVQRFASHKWLPKTKKETFPTLCYEAVKLHVIKDNLTAIEALETHKENLKKKKK